MQNFLGEGLTVLLMCSHRLHHDWMSFLCWYSFQQNLPECSFSVVASRQDMKYSLFSWTKRAGVRLVTTRSNHPEEMMSAATAACRRNPLLVVTPDIVCVRDFCGGIFSLTRNARKGGVSYTCDESLEHEEDDGLWQPAESQTLCNFVSYENGWGNFKMQSWIDRTGSPLSNHRKVTPGGGANEARLAEVWRGASGVFHALTRS